MSDNPWSPVSFPGRNVVARPRSSWSQGDFASDLFYYIARGAANAGDLPRRLCALHALTGVTGVNGDRAGDVYTLMVQYGYPAPILQVSTGPAPGHVDVWLRKDTPGLAYSMETRSHATGSQWQTLDLPAVDTNTTWSIGSDLPPGSTNAFYRVNTEPIPATSPDWP